MVWKTQNDLMSSKCYVKMDGKLGGFERPSCDYKLKSLISEGGQGCVYVAEPPNGGQECAVKKSTVNGVEKVISAISEGELLGQVDHPNIVRVLDNFFVRSEVESEFFCYLVMELCESDLFHILDKKSEKMEHFSELALLNYTDSICHVLSHLHTKEYIDPFTSERGRMIYRDLKPENILLYTSNREEHDYLLKLGDFGISRIDYATQKTVLGTHYYQPPEMFSSGAAVAKYDEKVDLFSLGCTIFYLMKLSARKPFYNTQSIHGHLLDDGDSVPLTYSDEFVEIVVSMLEKDPRKRPSADEVLRRLKYIRKAKGTPVTPTIGKRTPRTPRTPMTPLHQRRARIKDFSLSTDKKKRVKEKDNSQRQLKTSVHLSSKRFCLSVETKVAGRAENFSSERLFFDFKDIVDITVEYEEKREILVIISGQGPRLVRLDGRNEEIIEDVMENMKTEFRMEFEDGISGFLGDVWEKCIAESNHFPSERERIKKIIGKLDPVLEMESGIDELGI